MKTRILLSLAAALLTAACDQTTTGSGNQPEPVAAVEVAPGDVTLTAGQTRALGATVRGRSGGVLTGRAIAWTSSNEAVATVSASGVVTAVAEGTAAITARSEGRQGQAVVTVNRAGPPPATPVHTVEILPAGPVITMQHNDLLQLTVVAKAADGTVLTGRPVGWFSSNPGPVFVNYQGRVTAQAPGEAVITAIVEGKQAQVTIRIPMVVNRVMVSHNLSTILKGESFQMYATTYGPGNEELDWPVTWSSSAPSVLAIDASGQATAVGVGTAVITATVGGVSGTSTITVGDWTHHELQKVDGQALPASGWTLTSTDPQGVQHTITYQVREGALRLLNNDTYVQRLVVAYSVDGGPWLSTLWVDRGSYAVEVGASVIYFWSQNNLPNFTGRWLENGGMEITRKMVVSGEDLTFTHAAP